MPKYIGNLKCPQESGGGMWELAIIYDAPQVLSTGVAGMTVGGFSGTGMAFGGSRVTITPPGRQGTVAHLA